LVAVSDAEIMDPLSLHVGLNPLQCHVACDMHVMYVCLQVRQ